LTETETLLDADRHVVPATTDAHAHLLNSADMPPLLAGACSLTMTTAAMR
jgi:hypothetical protein